MNRPLLVAGIVALLLLSQVLTGWVDTLYAGEEYEGSADWYLAGGNYFYRMAEEAEDDNEKIQLYLQSLAIYQEGISEYPQDIPLKYNYEYVREKLDISLSEKGEGEEGDGEEGEEGEGEEGQGEEQEGQEGQENEEGDEQDSASEGEDSDEPDQDAIDRILKMLEQQEEQSLKNNQEVKEGSEGGYGW